jgi:hypothetical protein
LRFDIYILYIQIKQEKYVFFYGGKDKQWIQQFGKQATSLANNKEINVSINFLCLENGKKGENDLKIRGHFWIIIESLFLSANTDKETEQNTAMLEIQKLLSFKNESGWAILSKGSKVVVSDIGKKNFQGLMKCPYCTRLMETYVSFKCCHIDGAMNALH